MTLGLLQLVGRRALVTGGGTGLGRQMTHALAEAGADVVICGRRLAPLEQCAAEARQYGVQASAIAADVTTEAGISALRDGAGRVDILVNNAGGGEVKPWLDVTMDDWRRITAVNLDAPFRLIQVFAPPMMERRWGRIINISSIYGLIAGDARRYPGTEWDNAPYFASKHGLQGITHYFGARLAPFGVCVNSICPGMFPNTENNAELASPALEAVLSDGTPMARVGVDDDLKAAVVFLASPGAKFVTGQSVVVDGGWTIW
jgi:NAD(P)-dependent dehydrogenase (short-subunit alcohol dehydrogenase family)